MIGEITAGQLKPQWTFEIVYDDNTFPNIAGATITGAIRDGATVKTLTTGNFTITVDGSGTAHPKITYTQIAADVDTPGSWEYIVKVSVASKPIYLRGNFTVKPTFGSL